MPDTCYLYYTLFDFPTHKRNPDKFIKGIGKQPLSITTYRKGQVYYHRLPCNEVKSFMKTVKAEAKRNNVKVAFSGDKYDNHKVLI